MERDAGHTLVASRQTAAARNLFNVYTLVLREMPRLACPRGRPGQAEFADNMNTARHFLIPPFGRIRNRRVAFEM